MPLQKGVQNNVSGFNSFDYKMLMFENAMFAHVPYILIRHTLSLLLCASRSCLSFLFTRYLCIVKNYMLSIFMLSGFIQCSI